MNNKIMERWKAKKGLSGIKDYGVVSVRMEKKTRWKDPRGHRTKCIVPDCGEIAGLGNWR